MADYSIVSTGSPIVPYNVDVTFPLNVSVTYNQQVQSQNEGAALDAQFQSYADDMEDEIKASTFFTTQDTNRNASCSLAPDPTQIPNGEGWTPYIATVTFTIENAVVLQNRDISTELTGEEKDAFLADFANTVESNFKSERGWVDL